MFPIWGWLDPQIQKLWIRETGCGSSYWVRIPSVLLALQLSQHSEEHPVHRRLLRNALFKVYSWTGEVDPRVNTYKDLSSNSQYPHRARCNCAYLEPQCSNGKMEGKKPYFLSHMRRMMRINLSLHAAANIWLSSLIDLRASEHIHIHTEELGSYKCHIFSSQTPSFITQGKVKVYFQVCLVNTGIPETLWLARESIQQWDQ